MDFDPAPLLFLCCPVQAHSTKARKLMWPSPSSRTKEMVDVRKSGIVLWAALTGDLLWSASVQLTLGSLYLVAFASFR